MSLKEDLDKILRTPEDDARDAARAQEATNAAARAAVAKARDLGYARVKEAGEIIGDRIPAMTTGIDNDGAFLEATGKRVAVGASADGQSLIVKRPDGKEVRLIYSTVQRGLVRQDNQYGNANVQSEIDDAIKAFAAAAKG